MSVSNILTASQSRLNLILNVLARLTSVSWQMYLSRKKCFDSTPSPCTVAPSSVHFNCRLTDPLSNAAIGWHVARPTDVMTTLR